MDQTTHNRISQSLLKAREALVSLVRLGGEAVEPANDVADALNQIDSALRKEREEPVAAPQPRAGAERSTVHRRNKPKSYHLEASGGDRFLVESREPGSAPFKVPEHIVDHVVKALAGAEVPQSFTEIHAAVEEGAGKVPAYLARVALRFLMHPDHALIRRRQSRYAPVKQQGFRKRVREVWDGLPSG